MNSGMNNIMNNVMNSVIFLWRRKTMILFGLHGALNCEWSICQGVLYAQLTSYSVWSSSLLAQEWSWLASPVQVSTLYASLGLAQVRGMQCFVTTITMGTGAPYSTMQVWPSLAALPIPFRKCMVVCPGQCICIRPGRHSHT